jgi:hypothetical protein
VRRDVNEGRPSASVREATAPHRPVRVQTLGQAPEPNPACRQVVDDGENVFPLGTNLARSYCFFWYARTIDFSPVRSESAVECDGGFTMALFHRVDQGFLEQTEPSWVHKRPESINLEFDVTRLTTPQLWCSNAIGALDNVI